MDYVYWTYNHICAKHPKIAEVVVLVLAIFVVHFAFSYVKENAIKKGADAPAIQTQQKSGAATTRGDKSPAITGNGNSVIYSDDVKKTTGAAEKEK